MTSKIAVAAATGNLGGRIVRALAGRGAQVLALARRGVPEDKRSALRGAGAEVAIVDMSSPAELAAALRGADCLVSAVQGLRDVIVEVQSLLLEASIAAAVPRFIPSDFSTDFTGLPRGENRSFDLRREFHERLDAAPIAATAIFNGAFAEVLSYGTPLLDFKRRTAGYWEDADWRMDFTTMDDTASYTAAAALDEQAPRSLRIAGFQASARELAACAGEVLGGPVQLVRLGSLDELAAQNRRERAAHPEGEGEVFPRWQQGQYLQSMFSTHHASLDNGRYPGIAWTGLREVIARFAQR